MPHTERDNFLLERDKEQRDQIRRKVSVRKQKLHFWEDWIIIVIAIVLLVLIIAVFVVSVRPLHLQALLKNPFKDPLVHDEQDIEYHKSIVDRVNKANLGWKASYNKYADQLLPKTKDNSEEVEVLSRRPSIPLDQDTERHLRELERTLLVVPNEFDARKQWPKCYSIHQIHDQAGCGSCWAVASTSAMSDRICIASKGKRQPILSVEDLISCCEFCGGCYGSFYGIDAFVYWRDTGIVSGGAYGSAEGCRPYSIQPDCGTPCNQFFHKFRRTPRCEQKCQKFYPRTYEQDRIKSSSAYWIYVPADNGMSDVYNRHFKHRDIKLLLKKDIMLHGPVPIAFMVNEDFMHYESGVYSPLPHLPTIYGHVVKLIGWGSENGTAFWLAANSWGRSWGEHGYFRLSSEFKFLDAAAGVV